MSKVYYKATRPDGTDFRTGAVDYAGALLSGERIDVGPYGRSRKAECCGPSVLHASVFPTETLIGGSWPCRLFEVSGRPVASEGHKRGFRSLRVVREIDATLALGPQGKQIAELIRRAESLTYDEARSMGAAWGAAWDAAMGAAWDAAMGAAWGAARDAARGAAWGAARDAARGAAWGAARDAARGAAWGAARDAARGAAGLVSRDLIGQYGFTQQHYDTLTGPWRKTIGPLHPDDADLR